MNKFIFILFSLNFIPEFWGFKYLNNLQDLFWQFLDNITINVNGKVAFSKFEKIKNVVLEKCNSEMYRLCIYYLACFLTIIKLLHLNLDITQQRDSCKSEMH